VDFNYRDETPGAKGQNLLTWAGWYGWLDVVKLSLEYGADVKFTDFEGDTVLCNAVSKGRFETVTFLVEKCGCEVLPKNLEVARMNGDCEMAQYLIDAKERTRYSEFTSKEFDPVSFFLNFYPAVEQRVVPKQEVIDEVMVLLNSVDVQTADSELLDYVLQVLTDLTG